MSDAEAALRLRDELLRHWAGFPAPEAIDRMAASLSEDFVQHDHRRLHAPHGNRDDWRRALLGWNEVAKGGRLQDVEVLGIDRGLRAYRLLFRSQGAIGGGELEVEVFIVDRVRDGKRVTADVFDERDEALDFFETRR